ncbi:MAG TPA: cytidylyltransferase family protein [Acidilobales archaeon]|nr:cytidylyltransferase family protein [Acidilobales archaeon]
MFRWQTLSETSEIKSRAFKYLRNLEEAFKTLVFKGKNEEVMEAVNEAKRYFEDAKYYFDKGSFIDSIVCSTYAEGILDGLKMLKLIDFAWPFERHIKKVFVAGTFDIIHPGHIFLIKKAAEYGKVYVVVARDSNVVKFKGRKPIIDEKQRLYVISNIKGVYKAILGEKDDILKAVERIRPDIILLGPDQKIDENNLRKELERRGLKNISIIRLKEKLETYSCCSSSKIIDRVISYYCK